MKKKNQKINIIKRQEKVERLHIRGFTIREIAEKLKVSFRTINRDLNEIRDNNLEILRHNKETREWMLEQWSDILSKLKEAERIIWLSIDETKNHATKIRGAQHIVQINQSKKEIFGSLGLLPETMEHIRGGMDIGEIDEEEVEREQLRKAQEREELRAIIQPILLNK